MDFTCVLSFKFCEKIWNIKKINTEIRVGLCSLKVYVFKTHIPLKISVKEARCKPPVSPSPKNLPHTTNLDSSVLFTSKYDFYKDNLLNFFSRKAQTDKLSIFTVILTCL